MSDPDRKIDMKLVSSLSGCRWIEEKKNLIITGKTGTGKSYCSNALAICAIQKGIHVLYAKTSLMINELNDCQFTGSYAAALKKLKFYSKSGQNAIVMRFCPLCLFSQLRFI